MNTRKRFPFLSFFPILSFLLIFLLTLGITACQSEQQNKEQIKNQSLAVATDNAATDQIATAKFVVQKPFEGINNEAQEVQLKQIEKAQTLRLKDGAYLKIPAYAYQDAQGDTVRETVRLKYTALQDVASIIASGIPMKYRHTDGSVEWMQTGGMFKLEGYTDKGPVQLFEGKEMEVSFLSTTPGTFDFWNFDESIGNWQNLQKTSNQQQKSSKMPL